MRTCGGRCRSRVMRLPPSRCFAECTDRYYCGSCCSTIAELLCQAIMCKERTPPACECCTIVHLQASLVEITIHRSPACKKAWKSRC